jgi:hypothetical protein
VDGGEGHRGEITKSDFSGDEIKGPDSGEKNQREPDNRAAGARPEEVSRRTGMGGDASENEMKV